MSYEQKEQAARAFLSVLGKPDAAVLKTVVAGDVTWSFPGASPISGEARGVAGVIERARMIAAHGVKVEILHAVFGHGGGVVMVLHNTGDHDGRALDEQVAAVFAFAGERIARLDTYLSDVAMAEAFFAPVNHTKI
jgi:uncharacterized protein